MSILKAALRAIIRPVKRPGIILSLEFIVAFLAETTCIAPLVLHNPPSLLKGFLLRPRRASLLMIAPALASGLALTLALGTAA